MTQFDYTGVAGLYSGKSLRGSRAHATGVLRRPPRLRVSPLKTCPGAQHMGSLLEVDEARFDRRQIQALYDAPAYPLARRIK